MEFSSSQSLLFEMSVRGEILSNGYQVIAPPLPLHSSPSLPHSLPPSFPPLQVLVATIILFFVYFLITFDVRPQPPLPRNVYSDSKVNLY